MRLILLVSWLGLLGGATHVGAADARDMAVVGFGGGFQDAARKFLFQPWARASGTKLVDDTYNGEVARIYAMTKAHDVTWDVVMVEAPETTRPWAARCAKARPSASASTPRWAWNRLSS